MDKYTLLLLLNTPFVLLGYLKALTMYKNGSLQRMGLLLRLVFWTIIILGLIFVEELYDFVFSRGLTDTTPLSLADVLLVTGVIFCLTLCVRLYGKIEQLEKRITDLQENISIELSDKK